MSRTARGTSDEQSVVQLTTDDGTIAAGGSNALTHGLTARQLGPLQTGPAIEELRRALQDEFQPLGPTETLLVEELARHGAAMRLAEQAEGAVLRQGARQLCVLTTVEQDGLGDAILAAAVSTDSLQKLTRYRRAHERAFAVALAKLREHQLRRPRRTSRALDALHSEEACEQLLRRRFARPDWSCPRCRHHRGNWLAVRSLWQCAHCRAQIGLRDGTIMAGSRLPLVTWISALRIVLQRETISAADLAEQLGLRRVKTVRRLLGAIRQALDAAAELPNDAAAELSAPTGTFLRNGATCDFVLQILGAPTAISQSSAFIRAS